MSTEANLTEVITLSTAKECQRATTWHQEDSKVSNPFKHYCRISGTVGLEMSIPCGWKVGPIWPRFGIRKSRIPKLSNATERFSGIL